MINYFRNKIIIIMSIVLALTAFPSNLFDEVSKDRFNQMFFDNLSENTMDEEEYLRPESILHGKVVSLTSVSKEKSEKNNVSVVLFAYLVLSLFFVTLTFYWIIRLNNSTNISQFYIIQFIHNLGGQK